MSAIHRDKVPGSLCFLQASDRAVVASQTLRFIGDCAAIVDLIKDARAWWLRLLLCRNRARTQRRRPEGPGENLASVPDPAPGPEQAALVAADRERLAHHLSRLPWTTRAAVVLRHVAGLSYPEIAATLGRPPGTVKSDVHRGLQRLRAFLEEEP